MKNKMIKMLKKISTNKKAVMAIKATTVSSLVGAVVLSYTSGAFAAAADMSGVVNPIVDLLNQLLTPLLLLVGAAGALFCVMLGVKYATAEEPQEREKRKQSLKTAIIGYLLIFILVVALKLSMPVMTKWMSNASKGATTAPTAASPESGN